MATEGHEVHGDRSRSGGARPAWARLPGPAAEGVGFDREGAAAGGHRAGRGLRRHQLLGQRQHRRGAHRPQRSTACRASSARLYDPRRAEIYQPPGAGDHLGHHLGRAAHLRAALARRAGHRCCPSARGRWRWSRSRSRRRWWGGRSATSASPARSAWWPSRGKGEAFLPLLGSEFQRRRPGCSSRCMPRPWSAWKRSSGLKGG